MHIHIMLDLETWGKTPSSDIRSIGACVFYPETGMVPNSFPYEEHFYIATENPDLYDYRNVNNEGKPEELAKRKRKYPLTRDPETVEWWNDQSPEAQNAFANPVDLKNALEHFTSFICNALPVAPPEGFTDLRIWANGPQFDISILEAVYHVVNLPVPWHYRSPRDFRTITDAAGMEHSDFCNYGDAHNALHDAMAQAMTVCEAYKRLGLQR